MAAESTLRQHDFFLVFTVRTFDRPSRRRFRRNHRIALPKDTEPENSHLTF